MKDRFCLCSLKGEVTGVSLSALRRISYPTFVRKSVNGEDGNIHPRVFLGAGTDGRAPVARSQTPSTPVPPQELCGADRVGIPGTLHHEFPPPVHYATRG